MHNLKVKLFFKAYNQNSCHQLHFYSSLIPILQFYFHLFFSFNISSIFKIISIYFIPQVFIDINKYIFLILYYAPKELSIFYCHVYPSPTPNFLITIIWIKLCNHFWLNRYLVFKLLLLIHKNVCTWVTLITFPFFYRFFSEFIFAYISCLLLYLVIKVSIRHFPNTARTMYISSP